MPNCMLEPLFALDELGRSVIGAAIEVHRSLGPGYLEAFYEKALRIELDQRGIRYENQVSVPVFYRGIKLGEPRLDLVIEGQIVVELKAVDRVMAVHRAQLLSYLRAGGYQLGYVINFNMPLLKQGIERVISSG